MTQSNKVIPFVAVLHSQPAIAAFYAARLVEQGASPVLLQVVTSEATASRIAGPYGAYPPGPLSDEDSVGPHYAPGESAVDDLGSRLSAALAHAHLLVLHPRDARAADLQALLNAGWTVTGIVTLSQLVAFLSFQVRVVAGLQALAGHHATAPAAPLTERGAETATA